MTVAKRVSGSVGRPFHNTRRYVARARFSSPGVMGGGRDTGDCPVLLRYCPVLLRYCPVRCRMARLITPSARAEPVPHQTPRFAPERGASRALFTPRSRHLCHALPLLPPPQASATHPTGDTSPPPSSRLPLVRAPVCTGGVTACGPRHHQPARSAASAAAIRETSAGRETTAGPGRIRAR